jgi:hypothetical protein
LFVSGSPVRHSSLSEKRQSRELARFAQGVSRLEISSAYFVDKQLFGFHCRRRTVVSNPTIRRKPKGFLGQDTMRCRKHYRAEEKMAILRRHLVAYAGSIDDCVFDGFRIAGHPLVPSEN